MIRVAFVLSLIAYSFVASQPLFYLVALGRAQRALSAPAYIELRQHVNAVMTKRVPLIYGGALATVLLVLALSIWIRSASGLVASAVALVCLAADVFLMLRANVPINAVVDRWSPTEYPDDWERFRAQWFETFAYRQIVLLAGFVALLVGAVLQA
jgi:hypothetical protein